jgi:hypothetical protein
MQYETSPARATLAILAGAIAGALFVCLQYLWALNTAYGMDHVLSFGLRSTLSVFVVALLVWTSGLVVFGLLPWWLLHIRGYRSWRAALLLGATLTFFVYFALNTRGFQLIPPPSNGSFYAEDAGGATIIGYRLTLHGWWVALEQALTFAAAGALVGLIIWRTAYRRESTAGRVFPSSNTTHWVVAVGVPTITALVLLGTLFSPPPRREPYSPLATVEITASETELDGVVMELTAFSDERNLRLSRGDFPRQGRRVVNMGIYFPTDSFFLINNFRGSNTLTMVAYSHEEERVWRNVWSDLVERLTLKLGAERVMVVTR